MTKPPAASKLQEFKAGWPLVMAAMLGIGLGLSPVPFYTIGMLAPELVKAFGWNFGQVMAGLSVMTFSVMAVAPFVGLLADRFGVRWVTLGSVLAFGLSFMAFALNNGSLILFYFLWFVLAVAGAGTLPMTWTRAVNGAFDSARGFALGLSLLGTGIFGYLVKPLTAWLIAELGWRGAYLVIGLLPILIALPVCYFCFHDPAVGRPGRAAIVTASPPGQTFRQALREWRFWVLGAAFLPVSFAVGGIIPNMENILRLSGFERADMISLVQLIGLSVILGRVVGGWLIDRFWAPGVAFVLLISPVGACLLLAQGGMGFELAAVSILLIGFAAGVEYDLMAFLVARYFGLKNYSAIYGAQYGFFALGAGTGPAIFAAIFDRTGTYQTTLVLSAVLLFIGAVLLLTLGRYRTFTADDDAAEPALSPVH